VQVEPSPCDLLEILGGERGIRTLGTLAGTHDFQAEGAIDGGRETRDPSGNADSSRHGSLRDAAPVGQSRGTQRAETLAMLYEHAARLAAGGDVGAARALHATIGALLGDDVGRPAQVVDLASRRKS
jgi:hypothetical protein